MSQTLVSNLTLRIEQEKQMMQEHQEKIERFQRTTENLLSSSESSLKSLQTSAVSTTQTVTTIMTEAKRSLSLIESESKALALLIEKQSQETASVLTQQAQQLKQLKVQSDRLSSMSQEIAETAKIKKTLITSNIVLISIACIMLISSISLGYISKSKYNELQARSARLQQIEATTQQKIQEYNTVTTALYKARGGK